MKNKNEKKLQLGKVTVWNHDEVLDRKQQEKINGGSKSTVSETPVFC